MRYLLAFVLAATALSMAQTRPGRVPTRDNVSPQGTPAEVLSKSDPVYSEEGKRAKAQGTVRLLVRIGEAGTATPVRVVQSMGMGLDEAAMDAVRSWEFKSGTKKAETTPVEAVVDVHFKLPGTPTGSVIRRLTFPGTDQAHRPVLQSATLPEGMSSDTPLMLQIQVGPQGAVRKVTGAAEPALAKAIQAWRFQAAQRDGKPVASTGTLEIGPPPQQ